MSGSQQLLLGGNPQAVPVDPYFYSVTSLLHGDGTNGGQNNTFLDSSTNNFTITRNGNTTQGSFSPFSQTGWSNYFDGTGDDLTTPSNAAFTYGTGDFCVEGWFYFTGGVGGSGYSYAFAQGASTGSSSLGLYIQSGVYKVWNGSAVITGTASFVQNTWVHLAVTRSGTTMRLFVNGVQDGSATNSSNITTGTTTGISIGRWSEIGDTNYITGYVSSFRVVKGAAVYTSAFTVPTTPLTAISGTSLLTCQANRFFDASSNAFAITRNGDVSVQPFSPFNPTTAYSTSAVGGSGYFDGSGDYLSVTNSNDFDTNTTFTLECWIYQPAAGTGTFFSRGGGNSSNYWSTSDGYQFILYISGGTLYWQWNNAGSATSISGTAPAAGAWHHVVVGYNGTTTRMWLDGASVGTSTTAYTLPTTRNRVYIGAETAVATNLMNGYIAGLRFVQGTDVYGVGNTSISVPTAPPTAVTNTKFLANFTNGAIFDNAAVADYETVGNAQISTSVKKYGTGSIAFDGTGDKLVTPFFPWLQMGSSDWTIEMWVYLNSAPGGGSYYGLYANRASTAAYSPIAIFVNSSRQIEAYFSTSGSSWTSTLTTGQTIPTTTWTHVAVVKIGTLVKVYFNGNGDGSTATISGSLFTNTAQLWVGGENGGNDLNGYIDDFRISKGIARYPYNFTPPTAEFPNIGGTVTLTADPYFDYTTLLLPGNGTNGAQNNTFLDSSTNAFSITRNGNTTQGTFSPFSQTGWGNYFDGTGDSLTLASNAAFALPGDFTFEAWIYPTSWSATFAPIFTVYLSSTGGFWVGKNGGNFVLRAAGVADQLTTTVFPTLDAWTHIAVVRSGTTATIYYNGTSVVSGTVTYSFAQEQANIASDSTTNNFPGYISNLRLVKGTAVYTSNFTPPTTPLTAITNTSLLTCQSNRFIDNSSNAFAITRNGDVSVQAFSPFNPTAAWSAATYGGSGYFDGSGDYLTLSGNPTLTTNFTIEFWFYMPSWGDRVFVAQGGGAASFSTSNGVAFQIYSTSTTFYAQWSNGAGSFAEINTATSGIATNAWHHVAIGNNGTTTRVWIDGVSIGTNTGTPTWGYPTTRSTYIGYISYSSSYVSLGYMAGVRMVTSDVYGAGNTTITVPTAPPTAIANTSLLLNFTNAGIYDATSKNDLETVGNAQISTTQSKFGGSSMYFDGTGDYLAAPDSRNFDLGSGDWTIEAWLYISTAKNYNGWYGKRQTSQYGLTLQVDSSGVLSISASTTGSSWALAGASLGSGYSTGAWTHVAVTRFGNTITGWKNGVSTGTQTLSGSLFPATGYFATIGSANDSSQEFNGYIQDFRLTKGIARYTSNFTPPTTAFLTL